VGGWGFVSGFVQLGGGVRWERRGDGKGGGGDEMRDYCEVGENGWGVGDFLRVGLEGSFKKDRERGRAE